MDFRGTDQLCANIEWENWDQVALLLRHNNYSSSSVEQYVRACEQNEVIHVDGEILSHCSSQQKDRLLGIAVKKKRWEDVDNLLQDTNYSSSSVEHCVAACEQYGVIYVDREILSHCSSEQRDRLLKPAVKNERWEGVDILFQDNKYSCSSVETFVAACEQYEVIHVDGEILSHCSSEQRDRLLKPAVKNERWEGVNNLLQGNNYSSSSVEQFVTACEEYEVIYVDREILSHCSSEQMDRLLKPAVKNVRWEGVDILLQDNKYSCSSVETFVAACEQYKVIHVDPEILSHCSSQQKDRLLKPAVMNKRWEGVDSLLQDNSYSSSSVEQFVTACEQYFVIHIDGEILSHCSSKQRDRLLTTAVHLCKGDRDYCRTRKSWNDVKILLQDCNYSSSSVEMLIAACEQYSVIPVDGEILSHCSSEQKDRWLKTAVSIKRWGDVDSLLQDSNYSSSSVEIFITACEQNGVIHVDGQILSDCSSEQKDRLLKIAVKTKKWKDVDNLLKDSNFSSSFVEQFITLCEQHGAICVDKDLLSHCTSEQHGRLLQRGVRRRRWDRVNGLLQYLHYSGSFVDQLITACETHDVVPDCPGLLSHCSTQQLDRLLRLAKSLKRLDHKGILLKAGGSHEKRVWFIKHVCNNANDYDIRHILPHITDDLLSHCNAELLDSLLTKVTRIKRWDIIDKVLRAGGSHAKRVWVFTEACQRADHLAFKRYISPHCDDQIVNNPQSGLTVMFPALLNMHNPRKIVAECIRLGFSTHQPTPALETTAGIAEAVYSYVLSNFRDPTVFHVIASPFLLAVLRGMHVLAHMLYESGSCSYSQLLHWYTVLLDLSDPHTEDGRKFLQGEYLTEVQRRYSSRLHVYSEWNKAFIKTLTTFLPYLREMASTPRSLESSCRLVISHCLYDHGRRNRAVQELPLPEGMKDYLLFSDLTDPDYQPRLYRTMSAALLHQK